MTDETQKPEEEQTKDAPVEQPTPEAAPKAEEATTPGKKKKVNKLTVEEIDAKIIKLNETKCGDSRYAHHLLKRKNALIK